MSNDSIIVEKIRIRQAGEAGKKTKCRCCNQGVKIWKRRLDHHHAESLSFLVHLFEYNDEPVHYKGLEYPFGRKQVIIEHWSITKYWGLTEVVNKGHPLYPIIEGRRRGDPDVPSSGYYIPTQKGIDFAYNRIGVPKYCDRYNSKSLRFYGGTVTMEDIKHASFNWAELMGMLV
jgi:hypothetical protein